MIPNAGHFSRFAARGSTWGAEIVKYLTDSTAETYEEGWGPYSGKFKVQLASGEEKSVSIALHHDMVAMTYYFHLFGGLSVYIVPIDLSAPVQTDGEPNLEKWFLDHLKHTNLELNRRCRGDNDGGVPLHILLVGVNDLRTSAEKLDETRKRENQLESAVLTWNALPQRPEASIGPSNNMENEMTFPRAVGHFKILDVQQDALDPFWLRQTLLENILSEICRADEPVLED